MKTPRASRKDLENPESSVGRERKAEEEGSFFEFILPCIKPLRDLTESSGRESKCLKNCASLAKISKRAIG